MDTCKLTAKKASIAQHEIKQEAEMLCSFCSAEVLRYELQRRLSPKTGCDCSNNPLSIASTEALYLSLRMIKEPKVKKLRKQLRNDALTASFHVSLRLDEYGAHLNTEDICRLLRRMINQSGTLHVAAERINVIED